MTIVLSDCSSGWIDGRPTVNKCYYVLSDVTWNDANSQCATVDATYSDATLTTIDNQAENDFVRSIMPGSYAWIGGNDLNIEGSWW